MSNGDLKYLRYYGKFWKSNWQRYQPTLNFSEGYASPTKPRNGIHLNLLSILLQDHILSRSLTQSSPPFSS